MRGMVLGFCVALATGAPSWAGQPSSPPRAPTRGEHAPLRMEDATRAASELWREHAERVRADRAAEWAAKAIAHPAAPGRTLRFDSRSFGAPPGAPPAPARGRSLFISLHGGGGAPASVNDDQWRNQVRLYEPAEGLYVAPRAPTDTWNLWHEPHLDPLLDRLIESAVILEGVDPDRVYLMGYSAGGDGVYQLAPRMADRFAAAAMMAGHPNDADPLSLRNLPFAIHCGADDSAYGRNRVAGEWGARLAALRAADPHPESAYEHVCELHAGRGHWMNREDAVAVPWMSERTRDARPRRVVWKQDDVTHARLYWLAVGEADRKAGALVIASIEGQRVSIERVEGEVRALTILLDDALINLDLPVTIARGDRTLFEGMVDRTVANLRLALAERADPKALYPARVTVPISDTP